MNIRTGQPTFRDRYFFQGGVTRGISDTGFGWVGLLGALFFFLDIEKILYFWVYLYTFGTFWAQELDKSTPCTMWESADPQSALLEP